MQKGLCKLDYYIILKMNKKLSALGKKQRQQLRAIKKRDIDLEKRCIELEIYCLDYSQFWVKSIE